MDNIAIGERHAQAVDLVDRLHNPRIGGEEGAQGLPVALNPRQQALVSISLSRSLAVCRSGRPSSCAA